MEPQLKTQPTRELSSQPVPKLSTQEIASLYREAEAQEELDGAFRHPSRNRNIGNEFDPARAYVAGTIAECKTRCEGARKFANQPQLSVEDQLEAMAEKFDTQGFNFQEIQNFQNKLQGGGITKAQVSVLQGQHDTAKQFLDSADKVFKERINAKLGGEVNNQLLPMQEKAEDLLRHSLQRVFVGRPADIARQLVSSELTAAGMVSLMRNEIGIATDALNFVRTPEKDRGKFEEGLKAEIAKTVKDPVQAGVAFEVRMAHIRDRAAFLPAGEKERVQIESALVAASKSADRAEALFGARNVPGAQGQIYAAFHAVYPGYRR